MKKLSILFILLFICKVNFAQHLVANWVNYHVGADSIQDVGVAVDADNCIYVSGAEMNNATQNDIVLMKLSPDGTVEWTKVIDNNGKYEQPVKMIIGEECSVYITFSSNDFSNNTATSIIAKYDSLGNNIWTYEYNAGNTSAMVTPVDFEIDANYNVNVVGNIQLNGITNFALKLNSAGSLLWQSTWGANALASSRVGDLVLDNNGDLLVAAYGYDINTHKNLVYKISANGSFVWEQTINSTGFTNNFPYFNKIAFSNNKIYLTANPSGGSSTAINIYVCDAAATVLNNWTFTGIDNINAYLQDWKIDSQGNILLTGQTESSTSIDILTMKYDAQGNVLWQQKLDGPANGGDFGNKITTDAAGNVIVGGITSSSTGRDYTIIRYNSAGTFIDSMIFTTPGGATKDILGDVSVRNTNEIYVTGTSAINGVPNIVTVKFGLPVINPNSCSNPYIINSGINTITITDSIYWVKFIPDSNSVNILLDEGSITSNVKKVSLYKDCDTLVIYEDVSLDSTNAAGLSFYELEIGRTYNLRILRKCNTCNLSAINLNISIINYSLRIANTICQPLINGDFEQLNTVSWCANSPFAPANIGGCGSPSGTPSQVIGWKATSQSPQIRDYSSSSHAAFMWRGSDGDGEGIKQKINLIVGKQYRLTYRYKKWDNSLADGYLLFVCPGSFLESKTVNSTSYTSAERCFTATIANPEIRIQGVWGSAADDDDVFWLEIDDIKIELIDVSASANNNIFCNGECTYIVGNNACYNSGEYYSWSNGSGSYAQYVCPQNTTSYTFTYHLGSCSASAAVNITVKPRITASISGERYICGTADIATSTTVLTCTTNPNPVPTGTTYQWYYNGSPISGETNASYVAIAAGTYYCIVTPPSNYCGAVTTNTISVILLDAMQCCIYFSQYDKINHSASVPFNNQVSNGVIYQTWTPTSNPLNGGAGAVATIRETITIPNGYNVTISGMTLKFAPTGKIVMEGGNATKNGAKLTLTNSILTNDPRCGNFMWLGVAVGGVSNQPQYASNTQQGFLTMKNNSVIKNAWYGVILYYANLIGNLNNTHPSSSNNISTLGGIIQAKNSSFVNNYVDIVTGISGNIYNNQNPYSGAILSNISSFENCIFETNALLNTYTNFYSTAHVLSIGTKNITFRACTFKNSYWPSSINTQLKGEGIISLNSSFKVSDINNVRSTFNNLYYGIYAVGSGSNLFPFLSLNNDFVNCNVGVYASSINNFEIGRSSFQIYNETSTSITTAAIGLSFSNCSGFKVEENGFYNISGTPNNTIGILADNSGAADNLIYNNQFAALKRGISNQRVNSNQALNGTGLRIKCNKYVVNTITDFSNGLPGNSDWIANKQGFPTTSNTLMPAGNTFLNNGSSSDFQNNNVINPNAHIDYYYHNDANRTPQNITSATISVFAQPSSVTYIENKSCPSSYTGKGNGGNPNQSPNRLIKEDIKALENTIAQLGNVNPNNTGEVTFLNTKKQFLLDELLRDYLVYSDYPNAMDSVIKVYEQYDNYKPIDRVQPFAAVGQISSASTELINAINITGANDYTYLLQSIYALSPADSALFLPYIEPLAVGPDFTATRRALDVTGLIKRNLAYPEILDPQSTQRIGRNDGNKNDENQTVAILETKIGIYPNPASDKLLVTLEKLNDENIVLEMYDSKGAKIINQKLKNLQNTVDVSTLTSGTYQIKITNGKEVTNSKIEIIK